MKRPTFLSQPDRTSSDDPTAPLPTAATGSATVPVRQRTGADDTTVSRRHPAEPRPTAATLDPATTRRAEAAAQAERAEAAARHQKAESTIELKPAEHLAEHLADRPAAPVPVAGPRPRASLLATLGLITGVVAALFVLSGPLVSYGIALAGIAAVVSLGGFSAAGRRHVTGRTDALIGMLLALGAIVVGVLALTDSLSWLGADAESITGLREWLDTQFVKRF